MQRALSPPQKEQEGPYTFINLLAVIRSHLFLKSDRMSASKLIKCNKTSCSLTAKERIVVSSCSKKLKKKQLVISTLNYAYSDR